MPGSFLFVLFMSKSKAHKDKQERRCIKHGVAEYGGEKICERNHEAGKGISADCFAAAQSPYEHSSRSADVKNCGGNAEESGILQILIVRAVVNAVRIQFEPFGDSFYAPSEKWALADITERVFP